MFRARADAGCVGTAVPFVLSRNLRHFHAKMRQRLERDAMLSMRREFKMRRLRLKINQRLICVKARERVLCNVAVFPQLEAAIDVTERPAACAEIAAAMTFSDEDFG